MLLTWPRVRSGPCWPLGTHHLLFNICQQHPIFSNILKNKKFHPSLKMKQSKSFFWFSSNLSAMLNLLWHRFNLQRKLGKEEDSLKDRYVVRVSTMRTLRNIHFIRNTSTMKGKMFQQNHLFVEPFPKEKEALFMFEGEKFGKCF